MTDKLIGKNLEGRSHVLIKVLSQHFPGGMEENHEKPHPEYPVSWLRIKLNTSLKPVRALPRPACLAQCLLINFCLSVFYFLGI
jgi:hypothetical protein